MMKAAGLLFAGLVLLVLAGWVQEMGKPKPHVKHQVVKAWDGNPDHPDCSENGHPDPKHPGVIISDRYSDECEE